MRASGQPFAPAVASVIAVGSGTFAAMASLNHRPNCSIASADTCDSASSPSVYSWRMPAGSGRAMELSPRFVQLTHERQQRHARREAREDGEETALHDRDRAALSVHHRFVA